MTEITDIEALEALYGPANPKSLVKETGHITEQYARLIEASPFMALATVGPEGLDCSPRGELGGVVRIHDERTLMMPDRRGNNRTDSLRNIVRDPRVALLFLLPGSGTTMRVNGRAKISVDPDLIASFTINGKQPRSVIVIETDAVYFQCGKAIVRSKLWDPDVHTDPATLPTAGQILAQMSDDGTDAAAYDEQWPERAQQTMW